MKIQEVKLRCQQLDVFASKTRRILKLLAAEENCPDLSSRLTAISTQDEITSVRREGNQEEEEEEELQNPVKRYDKFLFSMPHVSTCQR